MPFASRSVIFDEFRFILPTRELLRIGNDGLSTPIPLGSRAAEILYLLLQRHGEVVSKNEIVDAVWPHLAIQDNNLTAQISALRRALDDGRNGASCIQTVPGRGYRFTPRVAEEDGPEPGRSVVGVPIPDGADSLTGAHRPSPESVPAASSPADISGRGSGNGRLYVGGVIGFLCAALIAYGWQGFRADTPIRPTEPPRLSIVVLPFANATGTPKDEELAAALTDDFMTDLAQIRGSVVVARSMAQVIAARKLPLPAVGRELAVRYVLEGNIRRSPEGVELNVQLSDAASATSIWAWQLKEAASEPTDLRLQVTQSLLFPLRTAFMDAEARRISTLPAATLTADDLLLKVSALNNHPPLTPAKNAESIAVLERALALDPMSADLMISLADQILRPISEFADRNSIDERLLRARTLADRARARGQF
jgi:adenylate cyclase